MMTSSIVFPPLRRAFASSAASASALKRTPLYNAHLALKCKMVPFAGYELPVQYADGVAKSHVHVREKAGLFDVSHMGQLRLHGPDRERFVERICVVDVAALAPFNGSLSLITNANGGIMDDTIVTRRADHVRMVVNGACKEKDMAHMNAVLADSGMDVKIEYLGDDYGLVALQGPSASRALAAALDDKSIDLAAWPFMVDKDVTVFGGVPVSVSRCGYTGEDGFEISVAAAHAEKVFNSLLEHPDVLPAGLGARDSLRLEAGLCLYGHDLDETTTPSEGTLLWTISKRRRAEGGFIGYDAVKAQLDNPASVTRKRVGFVTQGPPAREGSKLCDSSGAQIGVITSGTFSPVLKKNVAMGYVQKDFAKVGTELQAEVRGKLHPAVVTKMPFVPANYHRV